MKIRSLRRRKERGKKGERKGKGRERERKGRKRGGGREGKWKIKTKRRILRRRKGNGRLK